MTTTSLPLYSPSQISAWLECPRKWGWAQIDKIRPPEGQAAGLGNAIHKCLEDWLLTGIIDHTTNPRAAELAVEATEHLPPPMSEGLSVETKWKAQLSSEPHLWNGRIDWTLVRPEVMTIGDHKSTSNIAAWGKTAEQLVTDLQAIVYSRWAILEYNLKEVKLQWTYIQTRNSRLVKPVTVTLSADHVAKEFAKIDAVASKITAARQGVKSAIELPFNSAACDKYGGCPYQGNCNLSPRDRLRAVMAGGIEMKGNTPVSESSDLFASLSKSAIFGDKSETTAESPINPPESLLPPPPQEGPVDPVPATPKRKRRTKAEMEAAALVTQVSTAGLEKAADFPVGAFVSVLEDNAPTDPPPAPSMGRLLLFVNARPVLGFDSPVELHTLLEIARERIKAEDNLDDYRFADFGKGAGLLACHVEKIALDFLRAGVDLILLVDSRSPEGGIVLPRLLSLATAVIRGN